MSSDWCAAMLEVTSLAAHYGRSQALVNVSLRVNEGEAVAVLGPNAAGKSTTLNCISRLVRSSAGQITLDGVSTHGWSPAAIVEAGVTQVPEGRQLFPFMTVEDNLTLGAYSRRARPDRAKSLREVYERLPLLMERRRQLAGTLSGGEQQMVAIGRALMARPRLLMLDEPSLGLSPIMVQHVFAIVAELKAAGLTILVVEQNMAQALRVVDRAYVLNTGSTVMEASATEMRLDPAMRKAYLGMESAGEEVAEISAQSDDQSPRPPEEPGALIEEPREAAPPDRQVDRQSVRGESP